MVVFSDNARLQSTHSIGILGDPPITPQIPYCAFFFTEIPFDSRLVWVVSLISKPFYYSQALHNTPQQLIRGQLTMENELPCVMEETSAWFRFKGGRHEGFRLKTYPLTTMAHKGLWVDLSKYLFA